MQIGAEDNFSQIRADKGGFNRSPDALRAARGLRFVACTQFLSKPGSNHVNCQDDGAALLINLSESSMTAADTSHAQSSSSTTDGNDCVHIPWADSSSVNDMQQDISVMLPLAEQEVLQYIAGYVVRILTKPSDCQRCKEFLLGSDGDQGIYMRRRERNPTVSCLSTPSQDFLSTLKQWEAIFRQWIHRVLHRQGVMKIMREKLAPLPKSPCDDHDVWGVAADAFLTIRIHRYIRYHNLKWPVAR